MARFRWTDDAVAKLRRLKNLEITYAEIGAQFGISESAVAQKVKRLGWSSYEWSGFLVSRRQKGRKRAKAVTAKITLAVQKRARTAEHRERFRVSVSTQTAETNRLAALTAHYDARRGGPVLPHQREAFALARAKRFPAREAYAVACSIPQLQQKGA